jgi:3-hydroxybutyryl-CoA dehydrogenase
LAAPAARATLGWSSTELEEESMAETRALDGPIGLVGAGYIGHLFAQQFALAGYEVRAWSPGGSASTLPERLRQSVSTLAEIGAVEPAAVDGVLDRVSTHDDLATAIAPCAAVMESIIEDADAKSACYGDIEAAIGPEALLWSSTSNFPMTRLAAAMVHPERAIVVHPVQTQLIIFVEVVAGEETSDETVNTTMRFCEDVGLRAVHVRKEIPGFLWNRVWFALLREMLHLVDIGAADPVELDSMVQTTLSAFIPVFGPLQMTDLIGHDTLRDISNALYPELAADRTASQTIERHVADGRLGVKAGRGFYDDSDQRVGELSRRLYEIAGELADSNGGQR